MIRSFSKIHFAICCFCFSACETTDDALPDAPALTTRSFFTDISAEVHLDFINDPSAGEYDMPESMVAGGGFLDYDNDGDLDIYLIKSAVETHDAEMSMNRLFRQESDGTFVDVTESAGLGDAGYGAGLAVGDFDNDGDVDVYVTNYGPDALYRNNGDGSFSNVTAVSGIDNPAWGASVVFLDYDLDGFLDIYVTNYLNYDPAVVCTDEAGRKDYCGPAGFPGVSDVLYHNTGAGAFTDVSRPSGIAGVSSKGLGVVSADFNRDGLPDIYVANDGEENNLWINQNDGTFKNRAMQYGVAVNALGRLEAGMGIAVGFLSGDTVPDLFITHLRGESNTLYRSMAAQQFVDDSHPAKLSGPSLQYTGFGAGFFDYDFDGDLDLAVVNGAVTRRRLLAKTDAPRYWDDYAEPNFIFENTGNAKFRNKSNASTAFGRVIEVSRGLAFGDIDNDGDPDLLVTNSGAPAHLYRNDAPKQGNWLMIRAFDPQLQRDAIGAEIEITVNSNVFHGLVLPGYSYLASNDHRVHFGVGHADRVEKLVIKWPGGPDELFPGVATNQMVTLRKGEGSIVKAGHIGTEFQSGK